MQRMKIYLVGGAVRDQLLGRPLVERDFVVVGATGGRLVASPNVTREHGRAGRTAAAQGVEAGMTGRSPYP